jgi:hypothetical protein
MRFYDGVVVVFLELDGVNTITLSMTRMLLRFLFIIQASSRRIGCPYVILAALANSTDDLLIADAPLSAR